MTRTAEPPRRLARHQLAALSLAIVAWGLPGSAQPADVPSVRVLDRFDDVAAWTAVASDGVQASVHPTDGLQGPGLRLDFDLAGTAGFAGGAPGLAG